tara:strand:+ start:1124 stop:1492 length:369 start_codon:yes stop_codon:yes gene_type:complete
MLVDVNQIGCLAEYKFFVLCMELGFIISKPTLDSCVYDCVVDNGKRLYKVQVKSRSLSDDGRKNKILQWGSNKYKSNDFDYYAIYLHQSDDWLIIQNVGQISMRLNKDNKEKFNNFALLFSA